jgi:hypothetical protein
MAPTPAGTAAADVPGSSWARTPRPTNTPLRNVAMSTTAAAMNRAISCFPLNWISRKPSSDM